MTIIAWDGETLAADMMLTSGCYVRKTNKIFAVRDGIMGFSGDISICLEFMAWYNDGANPKEFPSALRDGKELPVNAMAIVDGGIFTYDLSPYPIKVLDKQYVLGSGSNFAAAAMHLGHSAIKAVQVANELCNSCGEGVSWLRLDGTGGTIS